MGLIAALRLAGVAQIWELALLYAIDGAATAFFNPASNAIVPARRLQEANALLSFSRWMGKVAGPAVAGVLLALGSPGLALAGDAATFAVSAVCCGGGAGSGRTPGAGGRNLPQGVAARLAGVLQPRLAGGSSALGGDHQRGLLPDLPGAGADGRPRIPRRLQRLGADRGDVGRGGLLGGLVALSVRPRRPLLVGEGFLVFALPVVLLAAPSPTAAIAAGAFVAGATVRLAEILFDTVSAQNIPPESLSRVVAYDWFGSLARSRRVTEIERSIGPDIGVEMTIR